MLLHSCSNKGREENTEKSTKGNQGLKTSASVSEGCKKNFVFYQEPKDTEK